MHRRDFQVFRTYFTYDVRASCKYGNERKKWQSQLNKIDYLHRVLGAKIKPNNAHTQKLQKKEQGQKAVHIHFSGAPRIAYFCGMWKIMVRSEIKAIKHLEDFHA